MIQRSDDAAALHRCAQVDRRRDRPIRAAERSSPARRRPACGWRGPAARPLGIRRVPRSRGRGRPDLSLAGRGTAGGRCRRGCSRMPRRRRFSSLTLRSRLSRKLAGPPAGPRLRHLDCSISNPSAKNRGHFFAALSGKGSSMRIAMVGAGYVGLVSGACFADFGHEVVCVDKDEAKIAALRNGQRPSTSRASANSSPPISAPAASPSPPTSPMACAAPGGVHRRRHADAAGRWRGRHALRLSGGARNRRCDRGLCRRRQQIDLADRRLRRDRAA